MNEKTLTSYIAVWGWQILTIMFLCFGFMFFALPRSLFTLVFGVAFIFIFTICESITIKRRREFNGIL